MFVIIIYLLHCYSYFNKISKIISKFILQFITRYKTFNIIDIIVYNTKKLRVATKFRMKIFKKQSLRFR
jgi:hypothetical protein